MEFSSFIPGLKLSPKFLGTCPKKQKKKERGWNVNLINLLFFFTSESKIRIRQRIVLPCKV